MKIALAGFGGIAPKIISTQLSDNLAQTAQNCRFDRGGLTAITGHATELASAPGVSTIFKRASGTWLQFSGVNDIARNPIPNDAYDRLYLAGPGSTYPKVHSQVTGQTFRLGIPVPATAPIPTPTAPVNEVDADSLLVAETIYYVCTFVNAWGAEGPSSVASVGVDRERDTDVSVQLPSFPSGAYNFGAGAVVRLYRSNQGTQQTAFQFVGDFAAGATITDDVPSDQLGEVLLSAEHIGPPDDDTGLYPDGPLQGIVAGPNGVLAGWVGNTVSFSEPYLPHAWPLSYRMAFEYDVVGVVAIQQGWLVLTTGKPYLIGGAAPASYSQAIIEVEQACVSRRSIVAVDGGAIYASPDGLVLVQGSSVALLTEEYLRREQWQLLYKPETIVAGLHEGRYIAFYDNGLTTAGFVFDPRGGRNALSDIPDFARAVHHNVREDALFVLSDADDTIYEWEASSTARTAVWKSKKFVLPANLSFGWIRVEGEGCFPVRAKIWVDGNLRFNRSLTKRITGLGAGFRGEEIEIELQTTGTISSAVVASSRDEVSN